MLPSQSRGVVAKKADQAEVVPPCNEVVQAVVQVGPKVIEAEVPNLLSGLVPGHEAVPLLEPKAKEVEALDPKAIEAEVPEPQAVPALGLKVVPVRNPKVVIAPDSREAVAGFRSSEIAVVELRYNEAKATTKTSVPHLVVEIKKEVPGIAMQTVVTISKFKEIAAAESQLAEATTAGIEINAAPVITEVKQTETTTVDEGLLT
ncbi:hypothetical protein OAF74_03130 [bacterium]|nr:hypothetical protein [bacterium]